MNSGPAKTILSKVNAATCFAVGAKLVLVCTGISFTLAAQTQQQVQHPGSHAHPPPASSTKAAPGKALSKPRPKLVIPNVKVLDQDGRKLNFYADLVKDKVVVINFVFTSCRTFCPMLGARFSRLQTQLGERLGKDVFLISISTDPETDTPERLKAWGAQFKAKAGWTLITGEKDEVAELLQVLTGDGLNKEIHNPLLTIVNDAKKTHRRAYGLEDPAQVIILTDELAK
ncbi:MAG TPA: SCO family protein [Pyrinomonadaceae bacterium]|nr:SCO family protein [Pyrinomonadaceae bacterium]